METLAKFQERNSRGCFYADEEKVGSGWACCTYPQPIKHERGECLTRKEVKLGQKEESHRP
jgi:hypothetical protein